MAAAKILHIPTMINVQGAPADKKLPMKPQIAKHIPTARVPHEDMVSDEALVWKSFCDSIAYSEEAFKQEHLFKLFSIPLDGPGEHPPMYVCISRATVHYTRQAMKHSRKGHSSPMRSAGSN